MEEPELIYCETIDTQKLPPPSLPPRNTEELNIPMSLTEVDSLQRQRISPFASATVLRNQWKGGIQKSSSRKQVLFTIAVVFLSVSSLVFMTLYFTTKAKGNTTTINLEAMKQQNEKILQQFTNNSNNSPTINIEAIKQQNEKILHRLENHMKETNLSLNNMKKEFKRILTLAYGLPGSKSRPGYSCLDIVRGTNEILPNGEYWISIDNDGPMKVFCDMKTNGGGWTLVTNIVRPDSKEFNFSLATDYRQISDFNNNNLAISSTVLGTLGERMKFTQLRFLCRKKIPGRTFHIMTKSNILGERAVQFFSAQSNSTPKACGSFSSLKDDNSVMAKGCSKWGYELGKYQVDKWSYENVPVNERLVNHVCFIEEQVVWIINRDGRWECDDWVNEKDGGFAISAGDFWKIYVR